MNLGKPDFPLQQIGKGLGTVLVEHQVVGPVPPCNGQQDIGWLIWNDDGT